MAAGTAFGNRFLRASGRRFLGLGYEEHGSCKTPFHFVQMADTQLGMEASFLEGEKSKLGWDKELALMKLAAQEVNRLRPAFCIVCGDLVDEWPSEENGRKDADDELRRRQEKDFKETMQLIDEDIPLLCLCGNHDIGNRPNSRTIKRFTDSFGDDYFSFWCHGVKCLVLNSQLWKDDTDAKDLREEMDTWLDAELESLASDPAKPRALVFSHNPPFVFKPDEENDYFNLDSDIRQKLLNKLASKGVCAWFCGHYHRNAGGIYESSEGMTIEVVVTGAVGTQIIDKQGGNPLGLSGIGGHAIGEAESGFRVVHVCDYGVKHSWKTFAELAAERDGGKRQKLMP
eukprot:TRINITY_DN65358_c0_g1_i1.p1 TRINITY_DN65358_c0_g1~~TRINITY_DN65358_c0_g1_i1.p1  ORF type:complete len:356 (-),score=74.93 TRINITY_DN65358_c0_g1_i1:350-1378(-)